MEHGNCSPSTDYCIPASAVERTHGTELNLTVTDFAVRSAGSSHYYYC